MKRKADRDMTKLKLGHHEKGDSLPDEELNNECSSVLLYHAGEIK